jgi:hypothetical protein
MMIYFAFPWRWHKTEQGLILIRVTGWYPIIMLFWQTNPHNSVSTSEEKRIYFGNTDPSSREQTMKTFQTSFTVTV